MSLRMLISLIICVLPGSHVTSANADADELSKAVAALSAVGPNAQGHREAQSAWKNVAAAGPDRIPDLLASLDAAGPLARNWIRAAIEAVVDRARTSGSPVPQDDIEAFIRDVAHTPAARRLAYEILTQFDGSARERLLAGFLDDPSTELRREAIDRLVDDAEKANGPTEKTAALKRAFAASRDLDQIKDLAAKLEKLGEQVDLPSHFGFVTQWKLIGPFDNTGEKGFDVAYPPEESTDILKKHVGKNGTEVGWIDYVTSDKHGNVDLNAALGKNKGATAYALTTFRSAQPRSVDIRIGSNNAIKVWVNGKLCDSRKAYHSGFEIDQYTSRAELHEGSNEILVKVCENEQTESWAQDWNFQLRVCDSVGTAIFSTDRIATK